MNPPPYGTEAPPAYDDSAQHAQFDPTYEVRQFLGQNRWTPGLIELLLKGNLIYVSTILL